MKNLEDKCNKCKDNYNVYIYTFYYKNVYMKNTLFCVQNYSCSLLAFSHSPASSGDREWFEVKGE